MIIRATCILKRQRAKVCIYSTTIIITAIQRVTLSTSKFTTSSMFSQNEKQFFKVTAGNDIVLRMMYVDIVTFS